MASDTVSTRYDATHDGGYDQYGTYEGPGQTTSVGAGGFNENTGIIAFATFDAARIEQEAARYEVAGCPSR